MSKFLPKLDIHAVSIEAVPIKNWREIAPRVGMNYKLFGRAKDENGKPFAVSVLINAVGKDAEGNPCLCDLAEIPVISGLLAKSSPTIDSLALKYGEDGKPEIDGGTGMPVYAEAVPAGLNPVFATYWFCTLNSGLRFALKNAELTASVSQSTSEQRMARDDNGNPTIPVYDAVIEELIVERRVAACGRSLLGNVRIGGTAGGEAQQAARKAAAQATPEAEM